jgi:hypothetical protein
MFIILDFVHHPRLVRPLRFGNWFYFRVPSAEDILSNHVRQKTGIDPISEAHRIL